MRTRHLEIEGETLHFAFRGKSGVRHRIDVTDRRLARIVRRCRDLPGQELFQYLDDKGNLHAVDSADINDYLREVMGEAFTAKDFRTWAGTVLAAHALQGLAAFDSQTQARRNVVAAIERVAQQLGNTISVCRKCYVHPAVVEAYLDGSLRDSLPGACDRNLTFPEQDLAPEEVTLLAFLEKRLKQEVR